MPRFLCVLFCLISLSVQASDEDLKSIERPRVGTHIGWYPTLQFSSDEGTRVGAISRIFNYGDEGSSIDGPFESLTTVAGAYASRGRSFLWLNFKMLDVSRFNLRSDSDVLFTSSQNQRYYGFGDSTTFDAVQEENGFNFYQYRQFNYVQTVRKEVAYGIEPMVGLEFNSYASESKGSNTLFDQDFGSQQVVYNGLNLIMGAVFDSRNSEFIATKGYYFETKLIMSPDIMNSGSAWNKWENDFRYYHSFISNRWLWLATQFRYQVSDAAAPLTRRASLGSDRTMRGLRRDRFISNQSFTARAELRSVWFRRQFRSLPFKFGSGIFVDTGTVGDTFDRLFETKHHVAYGFSLFGSYFTDDFLGHADVGFSDETTSIYLGLGHVF